MTERIAKRIARAGVCSRRAAEKLIMAGEVRVNGATIPSPALNVTDDDQITVQGKPLPAKEATRLWLYHKPTGLVTSHKDEQGRACVFDKLPAGMPRVISVGRLDLNSEGLLLLTNDGALARLMELPKTGLTRVYRARVFGKVNTRGLAALKNGVKISGIQYGVIEAKLEKEGKSNAWLEISLKEGKNREVRKVLGYLGLEVSRLIRIQYGDFLLGNLAPGMVQEVSGRSLKEKIKKMAA